MSKVFGIGLTKTGTKTLGKCMGILGYKNKSYDLSLLRKYAEGSYDPIYKECEIYNSFEDWPWPLLYKELNSIYPEAKFILTYRLAPEIWYESLCKHSLHTGSTIARKIVYGYDMPQGHRQHHINFYTNHYNNVIDYFKGRDDKLLTMCFENGSGWKELCSFLNTQIPNVKFPHENSSTLIIN